MARSPLGDEMERVAEHIRSLAGTIRYDPPTPGVVGTTRRQLARELRLEPLALRRACAPSTSASAQSQIDAHVRSGEDLARAVEDGDDFRQLADRIEALLDDLLQLAELVTELSTADPHRLATDFARARDVHVYGL